MSPLVSIPTRTALPVQAAIDLLPGTAEVVGYAGLLTAVRVTGEWFVVIGPDEPGDWPAVRRLLPDGDWTCEWESVGPLLLTHLFPAHVPAIPV